MRTKLLFLFFIMEISFSNQLLAWQRLEQLIVPPSRSMTMMEEDNFSQAVNALVNGKSHLAGKALAPLAASGVVDAQMALGTLLGQSELESEKKEAMKWVYYAAHGGNWRAQINLANAFRDGRYTDVNYEKSRKWLQRAAKHGDANIIAEEGIILNNAVMKFADKAIEESEFEKAENLLLSLAEQGLIDAQEKLAKLYKNGFLGKDAEERAKRWFKEAADRGSKNAQFELAMEYLNNRNASKELKDEGIKMLARAAEPGPAEAQYQLGMRYLKGEIVNKDQKQGIFFYRMAAEQGHVEAQYSLGVRYVLGEGVSKDEYEAHRWFKNAANQGLAKAMHNLALTYLYGMGTDKKPQKADQWFRSAADNGVRKSETFLKPTGLVNASPQLVKTSFKKTLPEKTEVVVQKTKRKSQKKREKISKSKNPPVKFQTVKGGDWFLNLPNKGYTLQVLSAVKRGSVDRFFVEKKIKKKNYLHYIDRASRRNLHVVQYGYYDTYAQAKKAAKKLSKNYKDLKPWVRDVKTIKNKIANL